jgi:hypothetical protein
MTSLQVFHALDPLRWRLECFNGILSQRHRAQERGASPMARKQNLSTHSQDASRERSTYVRRKEAEDVALAIRPSMWRHFRDINREPKARNSSVLICHFLAGSLTTIVAILLHLGRL